MERKSLIFYATIDIEIRELLREKFSRKFYRSLKNKNPNYLVNGVAKMNYETIKKGEKLELIYDSNDPSSWDAVNGELKILFEDEHFLIVYKTKDLLTIPTKSENNSLYQQILYYFLSNNIKCSIHMINRLDKDTEGLVLLAKDRYSAYLLNIEKNNICRKYLAICEGLFPIEGKIDMPILKTDEMNKRKVDINGKKSITNYKRIDYDGTNSIVEFHLETGRTHQIRVHTSYLGHAIVGDKLYGKSDENGLRLCSYFVSFINPYTKSEICCSIKPWWSDKK